MQTLYHVEVEFNSINNSIDPINGTSLQLRFVCSIGRPALTNVAIPHQLHSTDHSIFLATGSRTLRSLTLASHPLFSCIQRIALYSTMGSITRELPVSPRPADPLNSALFKPSAAELQFLKRTVSESEEEIREKVVEAQIE